MNRARADGALQAIWYGKSTTATLLAPVGFAFSLLVGMRRLAYRRGWFRTERLPVPVIVVGNITVGGTGKTPVVEWLAGKLIGAGYRPGIASRGYRGAERSVPVLVRQDSDVAEVGDETLLLARRTGIPIAVCRDRVRAGRFLLGQGVDVVVSDDGLQHYKLGRDVEIAVVDGSRGIGNGRMLPAGPLREPSGRLTEVDLVMINGESTSVAGYPFTLEGAKAVNLATGEVRDLSSFRGQQIWAVAGIGHPERFFVHLRHHGLDPVPVPVADHGRTDLGGIRQRADRPILMTEKDAVKYPRCREPDAWYVPVRLQMTPGNEASVLSRIFAGLDHPEGAPAHVPA